MFTWNGGLSLTVPKQVREVDVGVHQRVVQNSVDFDAQLACHAYAQVSDIESSRSSRVRLAIGSLCSSGLGFLTTTPASIGN